MTRRFAKSLLIGIAVLPALIPLPSVAAQGGRNEAGWSGRDSRRHSDGRDVHNDTAEKAAASGPVVQERISAAADRPLADLDAAAALLPLMERLSLYPGETLLAVPGSPVSALRAVLALQGLSRQLEFEVQPPGDEETEISAAADGLRQEVVRLAEGKAVRERRGDALDKAIARPPRAPADDAARGTERTGLASGGRTGISHAALTAPEVQSDARREMVRPEKPERVAGVQGGGRSGVLSTDPVTAGTLASIGLLHGHLQPPLTGGAVVRWSGKADDGPSTGVTYSAPSGAHVIAPCGGRVAFADRFRTYGLLLILDCGGGYNVVLSGLDRLDVKPGAAIVAGERVGVMPVWAAGSHAHRQALYVELRRDGTPVDPKRWMRSGG